MLSSTSQPNFFFHLLQTFLSLLFLSLFSKKPNFLLKKSYIATFQALTFLSLAFRPWQHILCKLVVRTLLLGQSFLVNTCKCSTNITVTFLYCSETLNCGKYCKLVKMKPCKYRSSEIPLMADTASSLTLCPLMNQVRLAAGNVSASEQVALSLSPAR